MENILEQFPEWQSEIERLCLESADFRELCMDYKEVRDLIATWADSDESNQETIDEYRTLLRELEADLKEYLHASLGPAELSDQDSPAGLPISKNK